MTSPEQRQLFPLFNKSHSKQSFNSKQSPTKSLLQKAQGSKTGQFGMKHFFQSKVPKGIKLNNLNQVNSIHSSVYNQSIDKSQQNSLRNIVNSSYWNSTQQSILQNFNQNNISKNNSNQSPIRKSITKIKNIEKQYEQQSPNKQKLQNIRSRSSSNLSNSKLNSNNQQSNKKNIFSLTQNIKPAQTFGINSQFEYSIKQFIQQKTIQKQQQIKKSNIPVQQQVQKLFTQHFGRNFIKNLIQYMNKDWAKDQSSLLEDRKIQMLINIMISKFAFFTQLINDFLTSQFSINYQTPVQTTSNYTLRQTKLISSILFKQSQKTFEQMKKLFEQLISKLPQQGIIQQQFILDQLKKSILQIYDPKYTYSSTKMKQRFKLYYEVYCTKRNSLQTQIKHKLKPQLTFIKQIENYLSSYQKELIKLKNTITNLEKQKQHLIQLLRQKTTFKPIQIDFAKLAELKQKAQERIKKDFNQNIVEFHNKIHQKNLQTIQTLKQQNKKMKKQVQAKQKQKLYHMNKLQQVMNSIPTKKDASTQIFNIPSASTTQNKPSTAAQTLTVSPSQLAIYPNFLANIITPFTFNQKITSSLISIITIDKILYDFQPIKAKLPLMSFKHYIYEWFIIRTGSKKISQILLKNFLYSVKKYRNKHKRFGIFNKVCGFAPVRGKNLQQDIQHLFYQTNLAWYYIVRLALLYRKKLNQKPTGYHIFPPINCEQIFKLSLRKSYQMIEQFFIEEGITVPQNLTQKIDHYAINEISKFKQHDEDWQKQSLQQIHILRQMNFDIIAGFVIDYVASQKAVVLQGLLRSIHLKQQQDKNSIGYGQFETIYRKYYKQKRSKIQLIYSKICLCNMNDLLNAENMTPAIILCIQDEIPLRSIFDKNQTLKNLVMSQKQSLTSTARNDKKVIQNPNSFQHFRQRFYHQFYDFYDMTNMLEQIFKIIRGLVRTRLKRLNKEQKYIETMLDIPKKQIVGEVKPVQQKKQGLKQEQGEQEQDSQQQQNGQKINTDIETLKKLTGQRTFIQQKLDQWRKIQQRIPHFASKILTIEQIIVHNMRRKQMFQGCQFAWRTLRDILVVISK